jgi:hypothetical protein
MKPSPKPIACFEAMDWGRLGARKVCRGCNGGWMSRIESSAKSLILDLMNQKTSIMTLTDADRTALARWATKTAFMIAVVQTTQFDLPWEIFQKLGSHEPGGTERLDCSRDPATADAERILIYVSLGLSIGGTAHSGALWIFRPPFAIRRGHSDSGSPRVVAATLGLHIPLWPLDQHILVSYQPALTQFETPHRYVDSLTI